LEKIMPGTKMRPVLFLNHSCTCWFVFARQLARVSMLRVPRIVVLASVPAFVVVPALAFVLARSLLYSMESLLGLAFVVVGTRRVGIRPCWRWRWPVRSSVGTGRCWSSAVALVVAFVPVRAGVDVDPFCLLIGAGVVLVDRLYSSAVARVLAGWSCSSAVAVVVASVLAAFALVLALAGSFL
jgi:hypothetical protein